jgi:serine/threonine protein kinase
MEYCSGGDLLDKIKSKTSDKQVFGEKQAAGFIKKLFSALSHCHASGIAHRDLKPETIMID